MGFRINSRNKSILKTTHNIVFINNTIILFLGLLYVDSLYFNPCYNHTINILLNNRLHNNIQTKYLCCWLLCCYFSLPCIHSWTSNICTFYTLRCTPLGYHKIMSRFSVRQIYHNVWQVYFILYYFLENRGSFNYYLGVWIEYSRQYKEQLN